MRNVFLVGWLVTALGCTGDETTGGPSASGEGAGGGGTQVATASGQTAAVTSSVATTHTSTSTGAPQVVYPVPDWSVEDPAAHGIDPAGLDAAAEAAEAEGSHCLVVVRHGAIVAEHYWQGKDEASTDKSFSVAKSYTSALVGIALARGDIQSLDQRASDFVPAWQGTEHEGITIRHLLTMTSGLHWDVFSDYVSMATLAWDQSDYAVDLDVDEPAGTTWQYHNGGVQIFEPVFRGATGMSIEAYAAQHLWGRIGSNATWNHDPTQHPTTYAHVLATCRDHARFGYLFLRGGVWADGPVIPAEYVAEALTPSQDMNRAYGYLWWLNGQTPALNPFGQLKDGTIAPFAPPDLFAARGFGDQFIDVIPSLDLVIVRIGPDPIATFDWDSLVQQENTSGTHEAIVAPILGGILDP